MAYGFNDDKSKAFIPTVQELMSVIYPVGSIYMSVSSTNPSALFGGTWVAWGSGRVPVGVNTSETEFNAVEKTGGGKAVTLTANQIPSHNHTYDKTNTTGALVSAGSSAGIEVIRADKKYISTASGNKGGGGSHNNLQPYITCYMWKRTA